ncbi:hypothetical protein DIE15_08880 [Burkholderia sp. Bp9031]|nr:hypothetical protein DIE15_08880 [Burkholderia sp. Bp9031]
MRIRGTFAVPAAMATDGPTPSHHYPQRDRGRLSGIGGCGAHLSAFGGGLSRGGRRVPAHARTDGPAR